MRRRAAWFVRCREEQVGEVEIPERTRMTREPQNACSGAPESGSPAYGHRSEVCAGTGRITLITPAEPPVLAPGAARVLLRILLKARARLAQEKARHEGMDDAGESRPRPG